MGTPAPSGPRVCKTCGQAKPLTEYYAQAQARDGYLLHCKPCTRSRMRRAPPEATRRHHLKSAYGITTADYDALAEAQGRRCAICATGVCATGKRLAVDHAHATGAVRGLLCMACNTALGKFQDSEDLLQAAINYLRASRT